MWIERNEMERCYKLFERARSVDDRNEEIIEKVKCTLQTSYEVYVRVQDRRQLVS